MKKRWILLTVSASLLWSSLSATIINIPGDYPTIQQGIDASTDGDTVLVQPGIYFESIDFDERNIVLGSLYLISGDTSYISSTIIDADSLYSPVVGFYGGQDSTAKITGFTLRNGEAVLGGGIICLFNSSPTIRCNIVRGNSARNGGGIYCDNSNPTIDKNLISENAAFDLSGGGICCWNSNATISNNTISNNSANLWGGGIYCYESAPLVNGNYINANSASGRGGGLGCTYNSNPTINNNVFTENYAYMGAGISCRDNSNPYISSNTLIENSAGYCGGGISCRDNASPTIINNVISENSADYGGGISCFEDSNPIIVNNTITKDSASVWGGGLFCWSNSNPIVTNSISWGNRAQIGSEIYADSTAAPVIIYCDIEGGWEGEGNIDVDPLFRDPINRDFHLMSTECGDPYDSPCIDAGSPAILDSLLDCSWGLGTILSDMGAYGGGDSTTVGIDDNNVYLPDRLLLMQNYPNPFNATTTIQYILPQEGNIGLSIYNILGQRVATLLEENKPAGNYTITWNADDYPSGVYFAILESGKRTDSIKIVLLK